MKNIKILVYIFHDAIILVFFENLSDYSSEGYSGDGSGDDNNTEDCNDEGGGDRSEVSGDNDQKGRIPNQRISISDISVINH